MFLALLPGAALACGEASDCMVGARSYRVHLPAAPAGAGALIFAHGYRGRAAGEMGNASLVALADDLGVALIALQAAGDDWAIPGVPQEIHADGAAEYAYVEAVAADAAERFGLDRERMVVSGFSAGAMLVWRLACHRGAAFAGFLPLSGTFWAPVPAACDSPPASLIHVHGRSDTVVPFQGRAIGPARQGDVAAALNMYGRHGGFGPAEPRRAGDMDCTLRRNGGGKLLGLCLFDGRHDFSTVRLRAGWDLLSQP